MMLLLVLNEKKNEEACMMKGWSDDDDEEKREVWFLCSTCCSYERWGLFLLLEKNMCATRRSFMSYSIINPKRSFLTDDILISWAINNWSSSSSIGWRLPHVYHSESASCSRGPQSFIPPSDSDNECMNCRIITCTWRLSFDSDGRILRKSFIKNQRLNVFPGRVNKKTEIHHQILMAMMDHQDVRRQAFSSCHNIIILMLK